MAKIKRPKRLESAVRRTFHAWAKARYLLAIKIHGLKGFGNGGWPDYLVIGVNGRVAFVELKAVDGKLSALQETSIAELRRRSVVAVVWEDDHPELAKVKATLANYLGVDP